MLSLVPCFRKVVKALLLIVQHRLQECAKIKDDKNGSRENEVPVYLSDVICV